MITRRTLLQSLAASTLLLGTSILNATEKREFGKRKPTGFLKGKEFHLTIEETIVNITGKNTVATTINGMLPGPTLYWKEGDVVTIHVTNKLPVSTSIHWHGIILPYQMDGVPNISYDGIAPGETFTYRFQVNQSGTFWYHSHTDFQEQSGLNGALVIEPKEPEPFEYDCDYVVSLNDWSDEKPESIYRKLKVHSDYYNFNKRTVGNFFEEVKTEGFSEAFNNRKMWNEMRMSNRDFSDVSGYTYTFLMNGMTPQEDWRAVFKKGDKVRLRFINQSAMTFFDIRIPGLKIKVVAADGNPVKPVAVDEFRIGVAEVYDVIVEPDDKAYCIFAQSLDRSGYAAGTLATNSSAKAVRPKMDKLQPLSMIDMGMGGHMEMDGMKNESMNMKHHSMKMPMFKEPKIPITQLPRKSGVGTAMRAQNPTYRLDDPGAGLRNNGRRVLCYADLKNYYSTAAQPKPDREIILHLTGNMERYMWSINGISYADSLPLKFNYGERIRVTFINDTMMNHPMHLHGMWSDLETGDEDRLVRKHTVIVQPGSKISYRVSADAKGAWAYHCHMLYHMPGMFRKVEVLS